MKDLYFDGLNKKRQCIRILLEKSMSAHKRMFLHWASETKHFHYVEECRTVNSR